MVKLVTGFSLQMIFSWREKSIFASANQPLSPQRAHTHICPNCQLHLLCASFRSSDCVLVVGLVAVGGHQGAVEGIHLIALIVPDPEPGKDNDVADSLQSI